MVRVCLSPFMLKVSGDAQVYPVPPLATVMIWDVPVWGAVGDMVIDEIREEEAPTVGEMLYEAVPVAGHAVVPAAGHEVTVPVGLPFCTTVTVRVLVKDAKMVWFVVPMGIVTVSGFVLPYAVVGDVVVLSIV